MELRLPAIRGIGGAIVYLVDRYADETGDGLSIYDIDFEYLSGVERHPVGAGFDRIDHLTHNVYNGRMKYWADYYETLFNFREIRYFDIKGEYTGLTSQALTAPDGKIRIPLNEEGEGGKGQIEEFLKQFNGEGIQHIALITDDLLAAWDKLKQLGVPFMTRTAGNLLRNVAPNASRNMARMRASSRCAAFCSTARPTAEIHACCCRFSPRRRSGRCSSNSSKRKGDEGFGEGNFKALFESLERDQIKRGALKPVPERSRGG